MGTRQEIAPRPDRGPSGFTLIEVAVAIAILGAGFATLISFQTRLMDNYVHERNLFRATLAAQYLMAFLEVDNDPPEVGDTDGALEEALRKRGYFDGEQLDDTAKQFDGWKLEQHVTSVDYAEFQDILRRIELKVSWDKSERDSVSLVLFMNTPSTDQTAQQRR
ncbi:MAG: prepilin-type N-terminal cleavage/methylation domain-containing protein [Bdellovibrionota bacterium]